MKIVFFFNLCIVGHVVLMLKLLFYWFVLLMLLIFSLGWDLLFLRIVNVFVPINLRINVPVF